MGKLTLYIQCLYFLLFINTEMSQVVKILPWGLQKPIYCTKSIPLRLVPWWGKEPMHQQLWYWASYPRNIPESARKRFQNGDVMIWWSFFKWGQHKFLRDLDYELIYSLWNVSWAGPITSHVLTQIFAQGIRGNYGKQKYGLYAVIWLNAAKYRMTGELCVMCILCVMRRIFHDL